MAIEASGGSLAVRWQHAFAEDHDDPDQASGRQPSAPALSGDRYVVHLGDELAAFDTASGEVLWRQVLDDFRNTTIPVTIVGDRLFETSFGGPALITMAMDDGRPLEELTSEDLFGDGNTHRQVHGPAIGDRLLVEGYTPEGQLLVTLLDLSTVEGAD